MCVSLGLRQLVELASGKIRVILANFRRNSGLEVNWKTGYDMDSMSKANYCRIHNAGGTGMGGCPCVPVSKEVYTNNRSGAAALRAHMLDASNWGDWDLGASY